MNGPRTLRDVFAALSAEGLISDDPGGLRVLPVQPVAAPSWYLRVFAGIGAWIAALLLLAFLFQARIVENEAGSLLFGMIACSVAVVLSRLRERGDFVAQLALSLSLLGQGLIAVGVGMRFKEVAPTAMAMIVLELILIAAYPDPLHRFLSGLAIVGAVLVILIEADQPDLIHILLVGLGTLAVAVSANEYRLLATDWWAIVHPLRTAAVVSLLGLLVLPLQRAFAIGWWGLSALGLSALLGLAGWLIARDLGVGWRRASFGWLVLALVLALGVGLLGLTMPGIIAALLVLVLGFWCSNRLLIGLAAAFLVFYLGAYYYSLQLTLLNKALAMIIAGALLLLLRWAATRASRTGGME